MQILYMRVMSNYRYMYVLGVAHKVIRRNFRA